MFVSEIKVSFLLDFFAFSSNLAYLCKPSIEYPSVSLVSLLFICSSAWFGLVFTIRFGSLKFLVLPFCWYHHSSYLIRFSIHMFTLHGLLRSCLWPPNWLYCVILSTGKSIDINRQNFLYLFDIIYFYISFNEFLVKFERQILNFFILLLSLLFFIGSIVAWVFLFRYYTVSESDNCSLQKTYISITIVVPVIFTIISVTE